MKYSLDKPDERIWPILKLYSTGDISGIDAAYEIQALNIPGYDDPSVSEVVLWSRAVGYGIPDLPMDEEEKEKLEQLVERMKKSDK